MSIGTTIDSEPNVAATALALKRALIETVSDAGLTAIDAQTMALLAFTVDLPFMQKFGGGVTSHNTTRTTPGSPRTGNFYTAKIEEHLADIDRRIKALGGT
jgi:hypothetical protein